MAYHLFEVAGERWTSADYTLTEMVAMEGRTRLKWWSTDFANEAESQRAAIETWYMRTADADGAAKRAGELTAGQIRVTLVDGDGIPDQFTNGIPDPKATGTA
jgi:hypothetical protein